MTDFLQFSRDLASDLALFQPFHSNRVCGNQIPPIILSPVTLMKPFSSLRHFWKQTQSQAACSRVLKVAAVCCFVAPLTLRAADFTVTTPGSQFAFRINNEDSPTLLLLRGQTYTFDVTTTAGFHPFVVNSPGVVNNNISSGTLTYNVPTNAANYYYNCGFHGDLMRGEILTGDFLVTTPGDQFEFNINGTNSPTLTLVRGQTYRFAIKTSTGFHPFHIESPGVDVNDIDSGVITYTVPMDNANYYYNCTVHGDDMRGEIITVPPAGPAEPPVVRILSLIVNSNLVLTSTGTNNWTVNPEYSTNVAAPSPSWFALVVQTNNFNNGTNETICGKPPVDAAAIRIRAQED